MEAMIVVAPVPGWYPDPTGQHLKRWWDGIWSEWVIDADSGYWY